MPPRRRDTCHRSESRSSRAENTDDPSESKLTNRVTQQRTLSRVAAVAASLLGFVAIVMMILLRRAPPSKDAAGPWPGFVADEGGTKAAATLTCKYREEKGGRSGMGASAITCGNDGHWGTHKAGLYYGIKTRSMPSALVAGLMWHEAKVPLATDAIRHEASEHDHLDTYGYQEHDGSGYGRQHIVDSGNGLVLDTWFSQQGGGKSWIGRVRGESLEVRREGTGAKERTAVLYFYVGEDCDGDTACVQTNVLNRLGKTVVTNNVSLESGEGLLSVAGHSRSLGTFTVVLSSREHPAGRLDARRVSFWGAANATFHDVKQRMVIDRYEALRQSGKLRDRAKKTRKSVRKATLLESIRLDDHSPPDANLVLVQVVVDTPFEIEIHMGRDGSSTGGVSSSLTSQKLDDASVTFWTDFEDRFGLADKGYSDEQCRFAASALSNLLGGLSYFSGRNVVRDPTTGTTVLTETGTLFTAVPSRSFFPRGFLWDEGFHQLLVLAWRPSITIDVVSHWLSRMASNGWIPREQILGEAARRRVPDWAVPQPVNVTNPPTMFLVLERLAGALADADVSVDLLGQDLDRATLRKIVGEWYPLFVRWYDFLVESQSGPKPDTFRWRGRDPNEDKLHPNTLSSGLDDYPRAEFPSADKEYHLDLLCWVAMAARALQRTADVLGIEADSVRFQSDLDRYVASIDRNHYSAEHGGYFDYGVFAATPQFRKYDVISCRSTQGGGSIQTVKRCPQGYSFQWQIGDGQGGILQKEVLESRRSVEGFVPRIGYVALFPVLLQLLPADSPRLGEVLGMLRDELLTDYGVRSLARKDPYHLKANAPGDEPYWRGPIWMPINFLAVAALYHYKDLPGPNQVLASSLYSKLRSRLVGNVFKEFQRTGYVWEQYNDATGEGQRSHPFTGWTALVVNIMAEWY